MDADIKITSQSSEVLTSGSFITFRNEESSLCLSYKGETIIFKILFIDEEGKDTEKDRKKEFEVINDNEARFTLYNYKSGLGTFVLEPMLLGTIGDRELFFQYRIDDLHNSPSKLVFYTFHLGGEVSNG